MDCRCVRRLTGGCYGFFIGCFERGDGVYFYHCAIPRIWQFGPGVVNMLSFSAVVSMIVGNLFALRQQNLKRFMAFSSIAQMGYLLIGISAVSMIGITSVVYFILIYIFSNLGYFRGYCCYLRING